MALRNRELHARNDDKRMIAQGVGVVEEEPTKM